MKALTHVDARGAARMVDVSAKPAQDRRAVARGEVRAAKATIAAILQNRVAKGNVLATARVAGILAAKKTADLVPMCHPLALTHVEVDFAFPARRDRVSITAAARTTGPTGVEMEALTAVCAAALTIYDMCKAIDRNLRLTGIRLVRKTKG
jgi:cyclic pyranopterin phosphate synthase